MARILIVDDDPALLKALPEALRLRMQDAQVDTCDSAREALARIGDVDYDAIVADIKMPGMDGLALLAEIRALRPDTPTGLITGHGHEDLAVLALRGGAYDFIQKPIDREYIVPSLTRAIEERARRRRVEEQQVFLEQHAELLERIVEERTRELRETNRLKDRFIAMLSHELRSPLSAIRMWASLLRGGTLDGERTEAEAKEFRLERDFGLGGARVQGDPARLHQIILTLLSNAVKFSPRGGRVLLGLADDEEHAVISVRDEGEGIEPEFLPHIFEPFRQAESPSTRGHGGLGLGLAIVHDLVQLHRGTIEVESKGKGQGATFTVKLPRPEAARAVTPQPALAGGE